MLSYSCPLDAKIGKRSEPGPPDNSKKAIREGRKGTSPEDLPKNRRAQ
jgi:hypothetical protein